jgi:streptogramin lyase
LRKAISIGAAVATVVGAGVLAPSAPAGATAGEIQVLFDSDVRLDGAEGIAYGPDGLLYIGSYFADELAAYDPELDTLTPIEDDADAETDIDGPSRLAVDQVNGDVWYTNYNGGGSIGRYDPGTGETETVTTPNMISPWGITLDAEGDAWFADYEGDIIGVVDHDTFVVNTYQAAASALQGPNELVFGPDGGLWFTNYDGDNIGRFDVGTETFDFFTAPTMDEPWAITSAGGHLWFTAHASHHIGRITTAGEIDLYDVGDSVGRPVGIDPGPDQSLYVAFAATPDTGDDIDFGGIARFDRVTREVQRAYVPQDPQVDFVGDIEAGPGLQGEDDDSWFYATGPNADALVALDAPEQTFTDVGPTQPFFDEIAFMAEHEVSTGFQPGPTYRPGGNTTRAAMSAFMYRLADEPPFTPPGTPTFADVEPSSTFFDEIEWMADEGISNGFTEGSEQVYRPGSAVTRQAMSAFMYRLAGEPAFVPPVTPTFSDVAVGSTFFHEIEWMNDEDITNGFPGGIYKPASPVTRQAMSAFMARLHRLLPH